MQRKEGHLSLDEIDCLGDEIAQLSAEIDAAAHRLLTLIRRFDASSGWAQHGALTCAHWLSWRIGLDLGAAREHVRVARALGSLPVIDEALGRGEVSYSKVRALTRVATAGNEATLLHWARSCTASQLEGICRKYRTMKRREIRSLEDEAEVRFVRVRDTDSGMVRIEAQLHPDEAALVLKALELAARRAAGEADVSAGTPPRDRNEEPSEPAHVPPGGSWAASDARVEPGWLRPREAPVAGEISAGTPLLDREDEIAMLVHLPSRASSLGWDASGEPGPLEPSETSAERSGGDLGESFPVREETPSRGSPAEAETNGREPGARRSNGTSAGTWRRPLTTPAARVGRADALLAVAEAYLTSQADGQRRSPPVEIVVHVEQRAGTDGLPDRAMLDDGTPLSPESTARLACDAALVRVVEDEHGTPLDVGRRTRTIPSALKRALRLRDRSCRFPTCTNRIADSHHIVPWSEGGATSLDNTILLCRRHHGFVHERGYSIERLGGNELVFLDPRGKLVPQVSAPPALEDEGGAALVRKANVEAGIDIHPGTSLPHWDGRPVDYDLVLHVLDGMDRRQATTADL